MNAVNRPESATVLLVDSHQIVRDGLRSVIEATEGLTVIGEASTAKGALALVTSHEPDIVVLDLNLPDRDGIALCREITVAHALAPIRCVVFTSDTSPDTLDDARAAGAFGYLLKTDSSAHIVASLERIANDERLMNPTIPWIGRRSSAESIDTLDALTHRERQIFELLADGLTNRQIAGQLFLAEKTVKNYVSNLLMKLGLHRRAEAAAQSARYAERLEVQRERLGYSAA